MDDKVVDLAARQKSGNERVARPVTTLFYPGALAPSSEFLIEQEGEALVRILAEEDASLMIRLFASDEVMHAIPSDQQHQAKELLRQLFESLIKGLRKKDSSELIMLSGVDRALALLSPNGVIAGLRIFLSHIMPRLSNRQLALLFRLMTETISAIDRWAIRSHYRQDAQVKAAFAKAGLEIQAGENSPFQIIAAWLADWASLPLTPSLVDDFEFFRRLIWRLPQKEILSEDEWRKIFRSLALSLPTDRNGCMNDRAFELFRVISRCARRLPFVQYLMNSHGRSLDMLGPELKDWVLVSTLTDESNEFSKGFHLWLNPVVTTEEAGLEPDELQDFFEGLTEKMRLDRERFELDWFDQTWRSLHSILAQRQLALEWRGVAFRKAESLASNIAADASKKVSVSHLERVIRQVCELTAYVAAVARRPRDANTHMSILLAQIIDYQNDGYIWRNGQRIAASLFNIAAEQDSGFADRLQATLGALSQHQRAHIGINESLGPALARVEPPEAFFACQLVFSAVAVQSGQSMRNVALALRADLFARRLPFADLERRFDEETMHGLALLCGIDEDQATSTARFVRDQIKLARLWEHGAFMAGEVAGGNPKAAEHLSEIARLLFMLPSSLLRRVDEERAFWITPELRPLTRLDYSHDAPSWRAFEGRLAEAFSPEEFATAQVFFKRTLIAKKRSQRSASDVVDLQPYHSLQMEPLPESGTTSEPFQGAVDEFISALEKVSAPDWLLGFARALRVLGDEERAWFSVYPKILDAIRIHGQSEISAIFDRVMLSIMDALGPLSKAHWFEVLAEGRALTQQLTIGHVWMSNADTLAKVVAPQMRAAMNNEPDLEKCVRDLGFSFEQMGKTLTEQTPVMAAIELPRFWFQNVSPFVDYPPVLWRLVALALRDATLKYLADDMIVSVASWCNRFGAVAFKLATSRDFAAKTLQAKGNFFSENKRDEIAWRNFLSGLLITAAYGENGRLPRSLLCQRLLDATPPLKSLSTEQWQGAASAIVAKFRDQMDEAILPGLIQSQAAVTEAFRFRQQMKKMPNLANDVAHWVRNKQRIGANARWQRYVVMTSERFGIAHPAHVAVSQAVEWSLPDEIYIKSQTRLYKTVFDSALSARPDAIRTGLLKRRPPEIPPKAMDSWRTRLVGYALGVAYGDECCQRQCLVVARLGPMREWTFEAVLELMRSVDETIRANNDTQGHAEVVRVSTLNDAWVTSELALHSVEWAKETVLRWKPFGRDADSENKRCVRDIGHVMKQIMLQTSGVQVSETLDQWYESHVLGFIRDSAKEPFAELPSQLTKTFRARFPKPVAAQLDSTVEPLRRLLEKD